MQKNVKAIIPTSLSRFYKITVNNQLELSEKAMNVSIQPISYPSKTTKTESMTQKAQIKCVPDWFEVLFWFSLYTVSHQKKKLTLGFFFIKLTEVLAKCGYIDFWERV